MKRLLFIFLILASFANGQTFDQYRDIPLVNIAEIDGVPIVNADQVDGTTIFTTTLKDSLISVWEFDESSGAAADAYADNDITATAYAPSGGKVGGALYFNGSSDYSYAANESNFDGLSTLSVSAWVNVIAFPSTNGLANIVGKGYNAINAESFYLRIYNEGGTIKLQFGTYSAPTSYQASWDISGWGVSEWHHVMAIYNGNTYKIYFDNTEVASTTTATAPVNTDQPITVGVWKNGALTYDRYFYGYIDQVAISKACWTSTERDWLYNSGNLLIYLNW